MLRASLLFLALALAAPFVPSPALAQDGLPIDPAGDQAWARELPPMPSKLPPTAKSLAGLRIALDPGHGGEKDGNKGPTGLREGVIAMQTAQKLRDLLTASGAEVFMTREDDVEPGLRQRAESANEWGADLFLSIHFNASGRATANYPSTWYHGDGSEYPASLDVARELSDSLQWWLRLPEPQHSGVYSDYLMYPNAGFAVLRHSTRPAVLVECSFYSNRIEEERLKHPEYINRIACSLYMGLLNWAHQGAPRWGLLSAQPPADGQEGQLQVLLQDGMKTGWGNKELRHRPNSVHATLNGERLEGSDVDSSGILTLKSEALWNRDEERVLAIEFENRAGQVSMTPPVTLKAGESWTSVPMKGAEWLAKKDEAAGN